MQRRVGFDRLALSITLLITAFFALTARFNSLPASSFVPAAVLSATGCGLLVTAVRKVRGRAGVGLWEAGLAGLFLALFQFAIALTYPAVLSILKTTPRYTAVFLLTWGLLGFFAIALSILGATLGHLAFAPLRPLPERVSKTALAEDSEESEEGEEDQEAILPPGESAERIDKAPEHDEAIILALALPESTKERRANRQPGAGESAKKGRVGEQNTGRNKALTDEQPAEDEDVEAAQAGEAEDEGADEDQIAEEENGSVDEDQIAEDDEEVPQVERQPDPLITYIVSALLLGFLPMMAGYVFAASYDFVLNANNIEQIYPAFYPTLSLLSGLLPWQLVLRLNMVNETFTVFTHLWRIPNTLGNPNIFDVQALEPFLLNAAALALLLLTMYGRKHYKSGPKAAPWGVFIGLEALLGLVMILPSNLWIMRGLEGILQFGTIVAQLPTISLLNPTMFTLNLVTGVGFCVLVGLLVRRQYQLWTLPRKVKPEQDEAL